MALERVGVSFLADDDSLEVVTEGGRKASISGGGGGDSNLIVVRFAAAFGDLGAAPYLFNTLQGGDSFGGNDAEGWLTGQPVVIPPNSDVIRGTDVQVSVSGIVPSTPDDLDITLAGRVTNADGTQVAVIGAGLTVPSPVTDTAAILDLTGAVWSIVAGDDLSDDGTGNLLSTAGGVYQTAFTAFVGWD